ncbi:hypothetical protein QO010_000258 [Caulobacter ginsengisoli]|uniref:SIR2-like domain-containing protein n=1 Tax=Caulobacter ginsengisoli TaxID=400775 RepID=A0ABU0IM83_9CAUL|nr:SIR2 family protein [Caulobacter ginsengisoli]MDQ0462510.1 hypothetical protein [Caulobacter ginsengisoli]
MAATAKQIEILKRCGRPVAHLRAQLKRKRLGLIFGAGVSKDIGFPNWTELVDRLAAHPEVKGVEQLKRYRLENSPAFVLTRSLASVTQLLFGIYRLNKIETQKLSTPLTFFAEQTIKTDWLRLIHHELYSGLTTEERLKKIKNHPYLSSFLEIIKRSPITVNYNFDDTLERMLLLARNDVERESTRGYEVADKPNSQFQKDNSVVYHPNGFLPSTFEDGTSADVIFSDEAFQDQLLSAATGKYVHLSNHLFRNTCLLIGLSLEDPTLQSLLRQNSIANPGNIHYVVHFVPDFGAADSEAMKTLFRQNFSSYGLYTIFLDSAGIKFLATIIAMEDEPFHLNYAQHVQKLVYYLVGSVGSGKSTAASNFRNLITYDEWIDERKPELAKAEEDVDPSAIPDINRWIAEQFRKKNYALQSSKEGIHLVDRAPLDPLTFSAPEERPTKSAALLEQITDNGTREICKGHIIHLECGMEEIRIRNSLKHKYWTDSQYQQLLVRIDEVYGPMVRTTICTRGRDATAVAREIAKVIFLDDYRPVDLEDTLKQVQAGTYAV